MKWKNYRGFKESSTFTSLCCLLKLVASMTAGMDHLQDVLKELGCSLQLVESLEGQKHLKGFFGSVLLKRICDIKNKICHSEIKCLKIQQSLNYHSGFYKCWLEKLESKFIAVCWDVGFITPPGAPAASMVLLTPSLVKETFTTLTKRRQLKEGQGWLKWTDYHRSKCKPPSPWWILCCNSLSSFLVGCH